MPVLLQICIAILTVGMLVMVVASLRIMSLFGLVARDIHRTSLAVRESAARLDLIADEARTLMTSLDSCVKPVLRIANRFEGVGERVAELTTTLLEELEAPVFTVAALARGVRAGTQLLLGNLVHRISHRYSPNHGGSDHE